MKIAVTQFSLRTVAQESDFWSRFEKLAKDARAAGSGAIVFPEYFSLSLMVAQNPRRSFKAALHDSRAHADGVVQTATQIARQVGITICLGTIPWLEAGRLVNRSWMIFSNGSRIHQDKIFMTRFESEEWQVQPGPKKVDTFDLGGFRTAILTCYDSEFATLSQSVGQAGVELLLVPSCTDTHHGYWRVRHCCEARAIENQMFVAMSSIVEGDPRFSEIDGHHGQAAVFAPCDTGFPPDGCIGLGHENQEGLTVVDLDRAALINIRKNGAVLNLRDQQI